MSRMLLEQLFESLETEEDLLQSHQKIGLMIQNIERLVLNCQKLEKSLGDHLSKEELGIFIGKALEIIHREVAPDRLDVVATELLKAAGLSPEELA